MGIFLGLLIGKPVGIIFFSLLAIRLGFSQLPNGLSVRHLTGAGFLGGIGFTMAIFVTFLAFGDTPISDNSKLAVLLGSVIAGLTGYTILRRMPAAMPGWSSHAKCEPREGQGVSGKKSSDHLLILRLRVPDQPECP